MPYTIIQVSEGQLFNRTLPGDRPTLRDLQGLVGGFIERAAHVPSTGARSIDIWCNDEGKLDGLPEHTRLLAGRLEPEGYVIAGDMAICAAENGESLGLTAAEVARVVMRYLNDDPDELPRLLLDGDPVNELRDNGQLHP